MRRSATCWAARACLTAERLAGVSGTAIRILHMGIRNLPSAIVSQICNRPVAYMLPRCNGDVNPRSGISPVGGLHLTGADEQGPRDAVVVAVDSTKTLWLLRLNGDP